MNWTQNYDPLGSWPLSTLLAALPVVTLFFVLVVVKRKVWESAFAGFLMAVVIAMFVFDMPVNLVAWSAGRSRWGSSSGSGGSPGSSSRRSSCTTSRSIRGSSR